MCIKLQELLEVSLATPSRITRPGAGGAVFAPAGDGG